MTELGFSEGEQGRVSAIDRWVALGAAGVFDLIEQLSDASWTVRRAAIAGLASLGDDAVGPLVGWLRDRRSSEHAIAAVIDALSLSMGAATSVRVVELLSETTPAVVADAAVVLGRRRAAETLPQLTTLLEHPDDNVAMAAIEALGLIGAHGAVEPLLRLLGQGSFFRAFAALQVLAPTGDPRAIEPIAALLDDPMMSSVALRALGGTGSALAIGPLAVRLEAADPATTRTIAEALFELVARAEWNGASASVISSMRSRLGPAAGRFADALNGASAEERIAILQTLGWIADAAVIDELLPFLDDPVARGSAIAAIERIAVAHPDATIELLRHGGAGLRNALLPVVRVARAGAVVRGCLHDEDTEVRARAAEALARLGETAAVPALFEALRESNPRVAHAAAAAIQAIGCAVGPLLDAVRSEDPSVRRHAYRIAAYFGVGEVFDVLCAGIADADTRTAELAIVALGALDDDRVDPVLLEIAGDPRDAVRAAAMRAAAQRRSDEMGALLLRGITDRAAWVRYYACQGLSRIERAIPVTALSALLDDQTPHVRIAAIEALARAEASDAWDALVHAARSEDPDVKRAALVAMGQRARPAALDYLLDGVDSADLATRLVSLAALARIPHQRSIERVAAAIHDPGPEVRDSALALVADRGDDEAADLLIDLALTAAADHPVHATLSRFPARMSSRIATRLVQADEHAAPVLTAALARNGTPQAISHIVGALNAKSCPARRAAAAAVIALGIERGREIVVRMASSDPDPAVRAACQALIGAS